MTYEKYIVDVGTALSFDMGRQRIGQLFFNTLYAVRPDIAEKVTQAGGGIDPFYDDNNLVAFLKFVEANWNEE